MTPMLQAILVQVNAEAKIISESRSGDAHFTPKGMGAIGMMLILDDANPMIGKLAKALGVPDGWKLTKVSDGLWAAFNEGDRLAFFTAQNDFEDDNEDVKESAKARSPRISEAKNHLGEVEYRSFDSWKTACKKVNAAVWFDGNRDICNAFVGPKPYKRGESRSIGEWDGEVGAMFQGVKESKQ